MSIATINDAYDRFRELWPESARTRDELRVQLYEVGITRYEHIESGMEPALEPGETRGTGWDRLTVAWIYGDER